MELDADAAYLALKARDARFDGRLFVGVTSTRIYCRPICRVRTPRRANCVFFETPAQAEAQAFRPCLKCRPEIAPGPGPAWTVMDASRTLARQAALGLDRDAASGEPVRLAEMAARLGVSDRHFRRIFAAEHGVTPVQYVQTRRLLMAKQLLTDSRLPVAQVALTSGFGSLRRFNAAFAEHYRMSPGRLRRDGGAGSERDAVEDDALTVQLAYRLPYDRARLLRFLAQRAIPGIETVGELGVRRSLRAGAFGGAPGGAQGGAPGGVAVGGSVGVSGHGPGDARSQGTPAGWIEASFAPAAAAADDDPARLRVRVAPALAPHWGTVVAAVRRWLDLDAVPQAVHEALADIPGEPGLRLPGSLDGFELSVRAVLGQQVSVAGARTLARRVVERYGDAIETPWPDVDRSFPEPARLAGADPAEIAGLGIVGTRARAIVALAQAWPALAAHFEPGRPPDALIDALCALPGIGPWTAHYIAMRGLGWPDAFPPGDVAVLKAMRALDGTDSVRAADARAAAWRPWRSYAVLRLWNTLENAT